MSKGNKNNKYNLKFKLLLIVLPLAVVVVLGNAVYAARNDKYKKNDEFLSLYKQTALFNPFTLSTRTRSANTSVDLTEANSDAITLNELIRIATRPPARSPGKPRWSPGPSPWHKLYIYLMLRISKKEK